MEMMKVSFNIIYLTFVFKYLYITHNQKQKNMGTNFKLIAWIVLLVAGIMCLAYLVYQLTIGTFSEDQILGIRFIGADLICQIIVSAIGIRHERRKMLLIN